MTRSAASNPDVTGRSLAAGHAVTLVGEAGFEPAASCSQSRCAAELRYSPYLSMHDSGIVEGRWFGRPIGARYTHAPVKSVVEPLEGNRVKVSVEVDEAEFERDLDAAFRRISREVRLPGFRPGKAPRRVLEAKLGKDVGREEALREALPTYYSQAVRENDVDVIAAPEIEITAG